VLSPDLLAVLVCPVSKQPLVYVASEDVLVCASSRLRYRIDNGVPVMLAEEAQALSESEVSQLISRG
jgi:uncharacterized protein